MELKTEEQVLTLANQIKYKTIKEIIKQFELNDNHNFKNKGHIGYVIENCFGIKKNNISKPDLYHLRIEIKTTPIKKIKNKNDFSLKERMVLNVINFNLENLDDFYHSSFYKKNQKILMFFYLFDNEVLEKDYFIQNFIYYDLSEIPLEDLEIIKNDWKIIVDKIKEGKAHELSERLTKYLGACPKGNRRDNSLVSQPFSNVKAMRRAYSFKSHYLKYLFMKVEYKDKIERLNFSKSENIVSFVFQKLKPFLNFNVKKLCRKYHVSSNAKHRNYLLLKKILNITSFNYVEEFLKEGIQIRTYTIKYNEKIQEHFQFISVKPAEFNNKEINFYDSELYNYFLNTKFVFIGFKQDKQGNTYISKISYFQFPEKNVNDLRFLWNDTKDKFNNGIRFKMSKNKKINNLISKKDGYIGHIRPKAKNKNEKYLTPAGDEITKQCYWLNKEFVEENFQDLHNITKI